MSYVFAKPLSKAFQKIWHGPLFWWPNFFQLPFPMVTKKFQSPSNGEGVSNGNETNSITFHIMTISIDFFWSPQKVNLCHLFEKPLSRAFQKHVRCHAFLVIKLFWSPLNNGGVWHGNWKKMVVIQHITTIKWWPKKFGHHLTHPHHRWWSKFV